MRQPYALVVVVVAVGRAQFQHRLVRFWEIFQLDAQHVPPFGQANGPACLGASGRAGSDVR